MGTPFTRRSFLATAFGRFTPSQKAAAVERGLRFIYKTSHNKKAFSNWGQDYLWCFYTISVSAADPKLKALAWKMGQDRARHWLRLNPGIPEKFATSGEVSYWVFASHSAILLGAPVPPNKDVLRKAAARFKPEAFLGFDPKKPIPHDLPLPCPKDKSRNPQGANTCIKCGAALTFTDPYDLLCDGIIAAYSGDSYGVTLGATLPEVMSQIPGLRPYRGPISKDDSGFSSLTYAVTHIIYALNDYGIYRLRKEWLPAEFDFLVTHLLLNIEWNDPETLGEFMDTLKSFGPAGTEELIRKGEEFLLARQNPDGSWGDPKEKDVYIRYHSTWTAIGGLMDFALIKEGVSFPEALRRAAPSTAFSKP